MVEVTVIIPQRNAAEAVAAQLSQLRPILDRSVGDYEIVVVDDGSDAENEVPLKSLVDGSSAVRVIQTGRPLGISAALTGGLKVARGKTIVVAEAGDSYPAEEVEKLLRGLHRADLVFGRRQLLGLEKFWHRITRIPRWLLLGLDVHEPNACFWAARAEALAGLELSRGMYRYLSTLVSIRGYRVNEVYVDTKGPSKTLSDAWPNPGDLLFAWWLQRRWRQPQTRELLASQWSDCVFPISTVDAKPKLIDHRDSTAQKSA